MKHFVALLFALTTLFSFSNNLEEGYKALNNGDREKARTLFEKGLEEEEIKQECYIALILLNRYELKPNNIDLMKKFIKEVENPSPYIYSLWFTDAVTSGYGKKSDKRFDFITSILENESLHYSLGDAMNYVIGMHYTYSNDHKKADDAYLETEAIRDWSFTGTFDNTSGSGYDKKYPPIENPEMKNTFKSRVNADIGWYVPKVKPTEPWIPFTRYINDYQGIYYAQTFVDNPAAKDVILSVGGSGTLKIWANDKLIIEREKELETELNIHQVKFKLPKGTTRILVQLGHTGETDYPNFIVRIHDEKGKFFEDLTYNANYKEYLEASSIGEVTTIPHFGVDYFEKKVEKDPYDVVNAIMLARCYKRSTRYNESIAVLKKALEKRENNPLLHYELLGSYSDIDDRTTMLKELEKLRSIDEDLVSLLFYDFKLAMGRDNLTSAEEYLEKIKEVDYISEEEIIALDLEVLAKKQEYQELIEKAIYAYNKYPENSQFAAINFQIEKSKDAGNPARVLEQYLKDRYNYNFIEGLYELYAESGKLSKAQKMIEKLHKRMPDRKVYISKLTGSYYTTKNFYDAKDMNDNYLAQSPFNSDAWHTRAYILEALGKKREAVEALEKSIMFNPNNFDARERLRVIEDMTPLITYLENEDAESMIEEALSDPLETEDNYYYVLKDRAFVIYDNGANIEYYSIAVKILNESGVDDWNETSIPFNSSFQNLNIEKAEVWKKSGEKVMAEEYYNELVFTSLEEGDVVYITYRLDNYTGGSLQKDFWHDQVFNSFVPVKYNRLRMYTPPKYEINIEKSNIDIEPEISNVDDLKLYEWKFNDLEAVKYQPYMPNLFEVGKTLSFSTLSSWGRIAEWYKDLALPQAKESFNVNQVYNEIFEGKTDLTEMEKAEEIYNYICDNIHYSSVPFRQSSFTPQKPMVTLSTQLGDCKDLSTLYYTLAKKAGIKTNLVLVNTRNKGESSLVLPNIGFNHCIIRIDIDGKPFFQELTNPYLAFGAIPLGVKGAQALVIPNDDSENYGSDLINIPDDNSWRISEINRNVTIDIEDENLHITSKIESDGEVASNYRSRFKGLNKEDLKRSVTDLVSSKFESEIELNSYDLTGNEERDKNYILETDFIVENDIKNIGGMNALKLPMFDIIYNSGNFPNEERKYNVNYWEYENCPSYTTEITVNLPEDSEVQELPEAITVKTDIIEYSLTFTKKDAQTIVVKREAKINNDTFAPEKYESFLETLKEILSAEDIYIAYK